MSRTPLQLLTPPGLVGDGLRLLLQAGGVPVVVLPWQTPAAAAAVEPDGLLLVDQRQANPPWLAALAALPAHRQPRCLLMLPDTPHRPALPALPAAAVWAVLGVQHSTSGLLATVAAVARGERQPPACLPDTSPADDARAALARLGRLQRLVLQQAAEGCTPEVIGQALGLPPPQVQAQRRQAMRRLGLRDQVQLVRFALRSGLIAAADGGPLSAPGAR